MNLRAGDVDGALAAATAGLAAAERAGDPTLIAVLLGLLGLAQARLGRREEARATEDRVVTIARQGGRHGHEGWAELRLGRLWAGQDPSVAAGHLLRALAIGTQLEDRHLEVHARLERADLAREQDDLAGARAELTRAVEVTGLVSYDPALLAHVWNGWSLLAEAMGCQGGQVAPLWALAALHLDLADDPRSAHLWNRAMRALGTTGDPSGPAQLAARAAAALARDHGHTNSRTSTAGEAWALYRTPRTQPVCQGPRYRVGPGQVELLRP